jgi:2-oxoisovalerate dehydrogenase E2 component (dihydrolipoyl transacylase)
MGEHVVKLPDVGEGIAEAELVEWHVKVGDPVLEDTVLAAVMTDKATVEIPSPVAGTVAWLAAEIGEKVAVGAPLVRLRVPGSDGSASQPPQTEGTAPMEQPQTGPEPQPQPERQRMAAAPQAGAEPSAAAKPARRPAPAAMPAAWAPAGYGAPRPAGEKPLASPAVRRRAREAGIDLRQVPGTGPAGRITHEDLDAFLNRTPGTPARSGPAPDTSVEEIKVIGLRRRIAERMELAHARIVPITYVEEIDVTALEELRAKLNADAGSTGRPRLTLLPFLMRAMVAAIREQPIVNAHYDDEAGLIRRFGGVHVGIATQTDAGLTVPVVRHVEARDIWDCAAELARLAEAARRGTATREELSGSTITITSLGALGGIATTPVINHPEVAIVGVNRMAVRPMWNGSEFVPRKVMNLSSSFDHRVVDGWNAAVFVQRIRTLLETPALIFMEG